MLLFRCCAAFACFRAVVMPLQFQHCRRYAPLADAAVMPPLLPLLFQMLSQSHAFALRYYADRFILFSRSPFSATLPRHADYFRCRAVCRCHAIDAFAATFFAACYDSAGAPLRYAAIYMHATLFDMMLFRHTPMMPAPCRYEVMPFTLLQRFYARHAWSALLPAPMRCRCR